MISKEYMLEKPKDKIAILEGLIELRNRISGKLYDSRRNLEASVCNLLEATLPQERVEGARELFKKTIMDSIRDKQNDIVISLCNNFIEANFTAEEYGKTLRNAEDG